MWTHAGMNRGDWVPSVGFLTRQGVKTFSLEADVSYYTSFIHQWSTHLSCRTWHTLPCFGLLLLNAALSGFMCESAAMTQVSLISAFIPLLPAVIRSPSCFSSSALLYFSFIFPYLFHAPPPLILLIHPALLNYLQSQFFSHSHLETVRFLDWIAPTTSAW